MVETRFPESGLSAEYGDIVISEVSSELIISVSYLGNWVLSEKYFPDSAGKVAFKNLGKIAESYFHSGDLSLSGGAFSSPVTFLISIDCDAESETILKYVIIYPSFVDFRSTISVDLLKQIPLSRSTTKNTARGRKEFISFYGGVSISAYVVYKGAGKDMGTTVSLADLEDDKKIYVLDVSPSVIATLTGKMESDLVYYNIYGSEDKIIRYDVSSRLYQFEKTFLFINCFGAQESFTCTGDEIDDRKWTREYGDFNDRKINYANELENQKKINTGYINRHECGVVEDMLNSNHIAVISGSDTEEVTILSEEFIYSSRLDEVKSVVFTYRIAKKAITAVYVALKKPRIFTSDFNKTFE